ncbi:MAG: type II secretion system minor pseudopilin GspJ [Gammaproteobacteria bacterium]|nr:type II secretion system minor pseudopilin GspJ [Gammaproteobacteria bacterium]
MMKARNIMRGFTLLELLVAISIFGLLSVIAYSGLSSVLNTRQALDEHMERLAEIQRTNLFLTADLRQVVKRGIRDEYGDLQNPLISNELNSDITSRLIELTRSGHPNPLGVTRSNLQRVAYRLEENTLYRLSWTELDRDPESLPYEVELCTDVTDLSFRFLDDQQEWHEQWPPLEGAATTALPRGVELILELEDWGEIRRLYTLVGDA